MISPHSNLLQVKYPAATVLLDLTASEMCIEKVAQMVQQKELLQVVVKELHESLARKVSKNAPNRIYMNRYRDLMIGIVLNLTCNVENESIINYMVVEQDIIASLIAILPDSRYDWPTNGSALALLQFSHQGLSNQAFYQQLKKHNVMDIVNSFINECTNVESKRHLYEIVTLLTMSGQKMDGIFQVQSEVRYAKAA